MTSANPHNPQASALFRQRYGGHPNVMTPRRWATRLVWLRRPSLTQTLAENP